MGWLTHTREQLSRHSARASLYVLRLWIDATTSRRRRSLRLLDGVALSLCGLAFSAWIVLSKHPIDPDFLSRFYLAAAALIGTIVVLAINLSLIPVQRAAEQYAPSILRMFREDRVTRILI